MKILFLSHWFPYPANNGSKLRIQNLLRGLRECHDVTLLSFSDPPALADEVSVVPALCSKVYSFPGRQFDPNSARARLGFLSITPRSIVDTYSAAMASQIQELLANQKYDLVIASQLPMAAYYQCFNGVPALFEEVELGLHDQKSLQTASWQQRTRHTLTWLKFRLYLSRLLNSFRAITVVSEQERALVARTFPAVESIFVVPNCVNVAEYRNIHAQSRPEQIIFTGSFRYHTNYEAMRWFVGEVFPLILKQIPGAQLIITGDHMNLPLPQCKNVSLVGQVENVKDLIASSAVAIAPIWSGGGTRLKILEAMAIGTPVVATSKGAEGLDVQTGEHLYIADDSFEFSERIIALLSDAALRGRLAKRANLLVQEKYDWGRTSHDFMRIIESIL